MDDPAITFRFEKQAEAMARLERKINFILAELKLDYPEPKEEIPAELSPVVACLRRGDRSGAILAFRKAKGASYNDAVAEIDALAMRI